jgi:hypothetical protein
MTSDPPTSELELVVLACAAAPLRQADVIDRVLASWISPAPVPTSASCFAALMSVREAGLLDSGSPGLFSTTARGHRLLQRALCGALGAPRSPSHPASLTFPQAMAMAALLPVPTLVTVLRTRLDALDREQLALAAALRTSHERGDGELHIAALNFREGLLNGERAFLFTFVGDVDDGFMSLGCKPFTPSPLVQPVR